MKFMVIVKEDETSEAGILPDPSLFEQMGAYNQRLLDAGVMLTAEGLLPSSKGMRVKFEGDKRTVIDGPFAEAKELVGGFWILQCASREEVLDWVKQAPFDGGTEIEIRQIGELEDYADVMPESVIQQERAMQAELEARRNQKRGNLERRSQERVMAGRLRAFSIAMSVDGFMAGPDQSMEEPLGVGGERLHEWAIATRAFHDQHGMAGGPTDGGDSIDDGFIRRRVDGIGATIMGRNMFGPVRGEWPDESWRGWWGDDPPYHHPVFVLTHHARPSIEMEGGTTFHFVTGGIEDALRQAQAAAGDLDIALGGGAATIREYLRAGLLDELHVAVVPILLGSGERIFEPEDGPPTVEPVQHVASDAVLHIVFAKR